MKKKFLLLIPLIFIVFAAVSCNSPQKPILEKSWEFYKKNFISNDGRVIDPWRNDITTSEGQSYAMLRAVLINDKKTFDFVYRWTQNNLKRSNDKLFAWLWGQRKDKTWGILDKNPASDADIDIAYALILAHKKWGEKQYIVDAKAIIHDIWKLETKEINYQRVLISGIEQGKAQKIELNPSYFAPYAFRVFDEYDKKRNWQELVDSSYNLLKRVTSATESGLPPDWFFMDADTGEISFDNENPERTAFSYDAIRVFTRVYLDYVYKKDKRALNILEKSRFFIKKYKNSEKNYKFYTNYKKSGEIKDEDENIGAISNLVPVFDILDKNYSEKIYREKVLKNYNQKGYWGDPENYYTQNLAWFGTYLYLNK